MRIILAFILSFCAYSDCLEKYQESYNAKSAKYQEKLKRYQENKNNALFSRDILVSAIGSKLEAPSKENIYEEAILRSAGIGYQYKTVAVMDIYKKLRPLHPFITPELIQSEFKEGLTSGEFCKGLFGKYRIEKAKKYVISKLKLKRDIAKMQDIKVNDESGPKIIKDNTSVIIPAYRTKSR